jgi:hypothetical protein
MARLDEAFARGSGHGLLRLGAGEVGKALPPVIAAHRTRDPVQNIPLLILGHHCPFPGARSSQNAQ